MAVADVHVDRQVVRGRLVGACGAGERALRAAVTDHLAADLAGLPSGEGYWVIRRLALRSRVGAGWTAARMSRGLAHCVTSAVGGALSGGPDADTVLWFPSRAAFLARFLCDLAEDRAAGRWEYAGLRGPSGELPGLELLAARGPAEVAEALLTLTRAEAETVADVLTPDEDRLLRCLAPRADEPGDVGPVLASLRTLVAEGRGAGALLVALAAAREHALPLSRVAGPARAAAAAARVLRREGGPAAATLRAGRRGDLGERDEAVLAVGAWTAEQRAALAAAVTARAAEAPGSRWHTAFGGAFLLVPLLDRVGDWAGATRGWSAAGGRPDAVARLACVALALGEERCRAAADDPVLRRLLGVPAELDVVRWLASVPAEGARGLDRLAGPPGHAAVAVAVPAPWRGAAGDSLGRAAGLALSALGRCLPGMAAASPAYLRRNVLDIDASVEPGERRCVVLLGHPPLGVLVSMAGLDRGSFAVPGAEDVTWTLTTSR